jgi:hypothetical protein
LTVKLDKIVNEQCYTATSLRNRLAFREFGALMGVQCYDRDEHLQARVEPILAMWEERLHDLTPEDLVPITMVMYSAALIPTGIQRLPKH